MGTSKRVADLENLRGILELELVVVFSISSTGL